MLEYQAVAVAGDLGVAKDANQMVLGSNGSSHQGMGMRRDLELEVDRLKIRMSFVSSNVIYMSLFVHQYQNIE